MNKFKLSLCAFALSVASSSVLAAGTQGTVTFNGELIAETCAIVDGYENIIVNLPTLSTKTLAAKDATGGTRAFEIKVEKCPKEVTTVAAHFESIGSTGFNTTTGNLTNQYSGSSSTDLAATNVEIRLYDTNEQQLRLGNTGQAATVAADGTATMVYHGGYYATDATTAGKVYAQALYTLAYP